MSEVLVLRVMNIVEKLSINNSVDIMIVCFEVEVGLLFLICLIVVFVR